MDADTVRRMRQSTLEAKLELGRIEHAELSRKISSPLTRSTRRTEAIERRDELDGLMERIRADLDVLGEMAKIRGRPQGRVTAAGNDSSVSSEG